MTNEEKQQLIQQIIKIAEDISELKRLFAEHKGEDASNLSEVRAALGRLEAADAKLAQADESLREEVKEIREQLKAAIAAAQRAADAAMQNSQLFRQFKGEIVDQLDDHMAQLVRLHSTDALQDQRIKVFEAHVQKTTNAAMVKIADEANRVGDKLSTKVTIPVGLIAAIATIVQYIIQQLSHR